MIEPDLPEDEPSRLSTLRALNILDSAPEERFDRLTRLAKRLFGVPIALVSLVDENRQWFKSRQGLDASETPRSISFCGHAILGDDIFLIEDVFEDERFRDNPLVKNDPKIRFYAGMPLKVSNGSKLGTLCLIDRQPRVLTEEDRALLRDLARMAEQELAAVQLATMDELTMISNRRGFQALALHAFNLCRRLERPASLLFFDLDLFKQINDRYGHAEGDRVLVGFSKALRDVFRESDVIGRLGGDEFVVLVTNAGEHDSQPFLDRFAQAIKELNQVEKRGYEIRYSVGVVEYDAQRHNCIDDLLKQADQSMYQRKRDSKQQ